MFNRIIFAIFLLSAATSYGMEKSFKKKQSHNSAKTNPQSLSDKINELKENYKETQNIEYYWALDSLEKLYSKINRKEISLENPKNPHITNEELKKKLKSILDDQGNIKSKYHGAFLDLEENAFLDLGDKDQFRLIPSEDSNKD